MAQGSGSYYDDYMRSNALLKHCGDKSAKKLLTDRNAYISFLEVQLERVSAACLSSQTVERRLAELESAQLASDQKAGSLSKVFRLHQEYVEQTTQQAQKELASHAAKADAWMAKLSSELEQQQPHMATLEQQFRQCEEYLPRLAESSDAALLEVKRQAEGEIEELKTLIFALETRMDEVLACQSTTSRKVDELADTATRKWEKVGSREGGRLLGRWGANVALCGSQELALMRTSVSGKSLQMDNALAQLRLVRQVESSWRAEHAEATRDHAERVDGLQERLCVVQQQLTTGQTEVKAVLKKCLDTQHLLSETVVALQSDADESKSAQDSAVAKDVAAIGTAIADLRVNQQTLKTALKVLQACALDVQQAGEARCDQLAERLTAAEDAFERRTEELTKVQRSRAISEVLKQTSRSGGGEAAPKSRPPPFSESFPECFSVDPHVQDSDGIKYPSGQRTRPTGWSDDRFYREKIRELEERLYRKTQREEEQRALFPERGVSQISSGSAASSPSYESSAASRQETSSAHQEDRVPRRTRTAIPKKVRGLKRAIKVWAGGY
ncbi:hypothetical protein BBJ28_00010672 [Nothophytophthora sp. Chile5]|nr:hypothetical protein BBJ28_00010672 [Nothophytophthora sp. Chile5]